MKTGSQSNIGKTPEEWSDVESLATNAVFNNMERKFNEPSLDEEQTIVNSSSRSNEVSNERTMPRNTSPVYSPSRDKLRRKFSMDRIAAFRLASHSNNETRCANDYNASLSIAHRNKQQRRFSMQTTSSVQRNFESHHRTESSRMVTDTMLKAMLDESSGTKRSRTTRRSTMDLKAPVLTKTETSKLKSRAGRLLSLNNIVASFDRECTRRELGVIDASYFDCRDIEKNSCGAASSSICSSSSQAGDFESIPSGADGKNEAESAHYDEKGLCPNSPHPTIEYPPLYFLLKRFPLVLNDLEGFYKVRWGLQYPLQRRIPFSKKLRKIGIAATWGECLLMAPFIVIFVQGLITSFVHPSVSKSGVLSRLPLIICFLTANHNSLLTLLLGIPFERAIKYHKISGYLTFLNGGFHTYVAWIAHKQSISKDQEISSFITGGQVNVSGTLLLCIIISMIVTASPYVRRKAFEVFYYFHIVFAILMMICAFYHSGILVPMLASTFWGGDLIIRKLYMARFRYPRKATISQLTDTVVEVRIPKTKGFDYNPGQYMKIAIPALSVFEWHPISISSSPYQQHVTLHIRKRGTWTKKLHQLAGKIEEVEILLEGPYGSLGVDLTSERYSMVMLLSGGIGVTPMQSIAHQLMYEHEWGERELKKLWFIWTARDPEVMENMDVVTVHSRSIASAASTTITNPDFLGSFNGSIHHRSDTISLSNSEGSPAFMGGNVLTNFPSSNTTDQELEMDLPIDEFFEPEEEGQTEPNDDVMNVGKGGGDTILSITETLEGIATDSQLGGNLAAQEDDLLELHCYLTAKEMNECGISDMPFFNQCRPDMKLIFLKLRKEAIRRGEKRVAICVCAPTRLVNITREACVKYSNRHVRFDFHSEIFD
jgi:predicted ferric reductase